MDEQLCEKVTSKNEKGVCVEGMCDDRKLKVKIGHEQVMEIMIWLLYYVVTMEL